MKIPKYLIILIIIILTYPFIIKYVYVQHNQFEQIPLILRYLDPDFLKHDWVTNVNSVFSPRYFFTLYMGNLAKLIPLPVAYFTNYLLTIALVAFATYFLAKKIFRTDPTAILITIIILYGHKITLGGNDLVGRDFDPSRMAFGFAVFGITLLLYNKYFLSGMLFAVAAYLHPLIGFEIPPIIYLAKILTDYFKNSKKRPILLIVRTYLKSLIIYFLLSSYAIYQYFSTFSQNNSSPEIKDALLHIIVKIRLSSHYYPLAFPLSDYFKFVILMILFLVFFRKISNDKNRPMIFFVTSVFITIIILCIIASFFTLIFPFYPVIIMQFFRLTVIVYWLLAIVVYGYCFYLGTSPLVPLGYRFIYPLFAFIFSYPDVLNNMNKSHIFFIILCLIWGVVYAHLKETKIKILIVLLPILFYSLLYRHYQFQYNQVYPFETTETKLALWAKTNIPADSILLVPPSFHFFKLVSERAIISDWMSGPYKEKDILAWFERIKDISGLSDHHLTLVTEEKVNEGYNLIDDQRIVYLKNIYKFDYIISSKSTHLSLPVVYEGETYSVYLLN